MANRKFSKGAPEKSDDYHGGCSYEYTSPDIAADGVKSVNINISYGEAMRLAFAILAIVLRLGRYDRSTTKGKRMGLRLSLKTGAKSLTVIEAPV